MAHLGTDLFICLTAVLTSKPIPLYPTSKVIDHPNSLQLASEAIFSTVKIQRDPEVQELAQWLAQRHALLGTTSVTQGTCHFCTDPGANLSPRPTLVTHSCLHSDRICLGSLALPRKMHHTAAPAAAPDPGLSCSPRTPSLPLWPSQAHHHQQQQTWFKSQI